MTAIPSPKESIVTYISELTERQVDPRERGYNTTFRNAPNAWGQGDGGEPNGWIADYDNIIAVLHRPDAISRFGFEMFEVSEGSHSRRYIRFAGEQAVLLDKIQCFRASVCLERRGFTFQFAYSDEKVIDAVGNYRQFDNWLGTAPLRQEFDLAFIPTEGAAA